MDNYDRHRIARRMGRRVRTGRVFKGLARDELANRVGLTKYYLERVESGAVRATAAEMVAIAAALELPLWFVFDVPLPAIGRSGPRRSRCQERRQADLD